MASIDALIIGGGVIGLATARALARAGLEVVIAEREAQFGLHTSSRNSEVIHAGIYYAPDSLKARLCIAGRAMLYDFCNNYGVAHRACGKLIVATDKAQEAELEKIAHNARASGVADLQWLDQNDVRLREPAIVATRALFSPATGIIDSHGYMTALLADAEQHGAILACHSEISAVRAHRDGWAMYMEGDDAPALTARHIINCAGLWASDVAARIEGMLPAHIPPTYYAKGCYYSYGAQASFQHLIYPIPEPGGLGIHLTLDLGGGVRFGPDVTWVEDVDYSVTTERHAHFLNAIRHYWPAIKAEHLHPAYAGVRPKCTRAGEPAADFRITGPQDHGLAGIHHLFGMESPGLTASLAIADYVAHKVRQQDGR